MFFSFKLPKTIFNLAKGILYGPVFIYNTCRCYFLFTSRFYFDQSEKSFMIFAFNKQENWFFAAYCTGPAWLIIIIILITNLRKIIFTHIYVKIILLKFVIKVMGLC